MVDKNHYVLGGGIGIGLAVGEAISAGRPNLMITFIGVVISFFCAWAVQRD